MNIPKILSIFSLNAFICFSLFVKIFGLKTYVFDNYKSKNAYINFNKIAKAELKSDVHAIILIPNKQLKIIKIFKTPIGKLNASDENEIITLIDSIGHLYKTANTHNQHLPIVEGDYKKWPKFYQKLKNTSVISKIYHVNLNEYTSNIWLEPGTLIQIDNQIENLEEFYKTFPKLFKKGNIIDLRATNRVGVTRFNNLS